MESSSLFTAGIRWRMKTDNGPHILFVISNKNDQTLSNNSEYNAKLQEHEINVIQIFKQLSNLLSSK